jgi:hypothetical protein
VLRIPLCVALAAIVVSVAPGPGQAFAGTPYVDGISDQTLPVWDGSSSGGYFASLFRSAWVGSPPSHIRLARYVVQWNVMSGDYGRYRLEFERWLTDERNLELVPDLALTS